MIDPSRPSAIDRPPGSAIEHPMQPPAGPPVGSPPRRGRYIGPIPVTAVNVLIALTFVGSSIFIAWVVLGIDENQIPLLASGFAVLGASFVAMAVSSLVGMWRAASRAQAGRALALAIFGGFAGLAAIGCLTVTALSALVWTS